MGDSPGESECVAVCETKAKTIIQQQEMRKIVIKHLKQRNSSYAPEK